MPMRKVGPIQIQSAIPQKQELNEEVASKKINAHDVQSVLYSHNTSTHRRVSDTTVGIRSMENKKISYATTNKP